MPRGNEYLLEEYLTVSNIVIILVQSSIADGESFLVIFHVFLYLSEIILASLATKNFSINFQLYINNKFKFKLVTFSLASPLFNCCNCNLSLSYSGEATHQRCFIIIIIFFFRQIIFLFVEISQ